MRRTRSSLGALVVITLLIWAFGLTTGVLIGRVARDPRPQAAPLVAQIRQLGELHTARCSFRDMVEHKSFRPVPRWARSIPGAEDLARSVTANEVLVSAEGVVEAGIDLRRIGEEDVTEASTAGGRVLRVRLPRASVYPAEVRLQVERHRPGLFWRDANIVPDAEEEVRRRFTQAALRTGILEAAERNAVQALSRLQFASAATVEFHF